MRRSQPIDAFAAFIGAKTGFALSALLVIACGTVMAEPIPARLALDQYRMEIEPLLKEYCYDCHGDGMDKGKIALDKFGSDADMLGSHDLWLTALMPLPKSTLPPCAICGECPPWPTASPASDPACSPPSMPLRLDRSQTPCSAPTAFRKCPTASIFCASKRR